jgi:hypothetical protein
MSGNKGIREYVSLSAARNSTAQLPNKFQLDEETVV